MDTIKVQIVYGDAEEKELVMTMEQANLLFASDKIGIEGGYFKIIERNFECIDGKYELSCKCN